MNEIIFQKKFIRQIEVGFTLCAIINGFRKTATNMAFEGIENFEVKNILTE
ncbi:MAG: hypothetical protein LBE82_06730 [Chitinophagaceae bacterium]|jgi:hypothetical protein|nr:hypothetical protein [Chitinophagaceae bacterium]